MVGSQLGGSERASQEALSPRTLTDLVLSTTNEDGPVSRYIQGSTQGL